MRSKYLLARWAAIISASRVNRGGEFVRVGAVGLEIFGGVGVSVGFGGVGVTAGTAGSGAAFGNGNSRSGLKLSGAAIIKEGTHCLIPVLGQTRSC